MPVVADLGDTERGEAANLTGRVPFNREGGEWNAQRRIRGGRTGVRQALCVEVRRSNRAGSHPAPLPDRALTAGEPPRKFSQDDARKRFMTFCDFLEEGTIVLYRVIRPRKIPDGIGCGFLITRTGPPPVA